ncbi:MAG: hypothetical protein HY438_00995 [DPANN group archaeon]|nr:hypothetical protein [DPANN group archaeon]
MRVAASESGQKSLEVLVNERELMVDKIIEFMDYVLSECGEQIHFEQFSDRVKQKLELYDFYGFDMFLNRGMHTIYGNVATLHYDKAPVFEAEFVGHFDSRDSESNVKLYVRGEWETKLIGIIKNKKQVIADWRARLYARKQKEAQRAKLNDQFYNKQAELEKRAAKLCLNKKSVT